MTEPTYTLRELGWTPAFQAQIDIDAIADAAPMRVAAVHRGAVDLLGAGGTVRAVPAPGLAAAGLAVGDWVLTDAATGRPERLLERKSLLQRRAAGTGRAVQPIAANLDTLFVVTSCNAEFNLARLERYLALARQAGVLPVLVLTKPDTCADPWDYADRARTLSPALAVETVNALDPAQAARLLAWCGPGETVALAGSSGVGKSTLVNAMTGAAQDTRGIREDDARGRHTTTGRSLHRLPSGGWLIDTPGMRALRLLDSAEGIDAVFADIAGLALGCRFADCAHATEPGCAVQAAVAAGLLDARRVTRWQKLAREDERNSATLAEARARDRAQGRFFRSVKQEIRRRKG